MAVDYRASWERFVRLALEPTYDGAPTAGAYSELGDYFAAPTTSPIGSLRHIAQRIRTIGTHGRRTTDQMAPIPAARRSEGSMDFPFAGDFGGALLYAAFGSITSTETPDPGDPLLPSAPFDLSGTTTLSLGTQPDGGCFFEFIVENVDIAGTITITGTSMEGEDLVEVINIAITVAAVSYYSRNSFATVDANGIVVDGPTNASVGTIIGNGIQGVSHDIQLADSAPSLRIEEFGDPGAGSGNSWFYPGVLINSLGLAFDASVDDGLLVVSPTFAGQYPTGATKSTYQLPVRRAYPAWTASAQRDAAPYVRLLNMNMNINLGAILRRTAQGSESPQQPVFGGRQIQGQFRILTEDDVEYTQFDTAAVVDMVFTFTTPYKLGDTPALVESLILTLEQVYLETYEITEGEEAIEATLGFYSKEDPTNNAIRATLVNNVPDGIYA